VRSIGCRCQKALAPASKGAAEILSQAVAAAGSASSFGEGGKRSFFPLGLSSTAILDTGGVGLSTERTAVWTSGIGMELNAAGRKETDKALEGTQTVGGRPEQQTSFGGPAFCRVGASCRHWCITTLRNHPALPDCLPSRGVILPIRLCISSGARALRRSGACLIAWLQQRRLWSCCCRGQGDELTKFLGR
jgi:hypothetical protein